MDPPYNAIVSPYSISFVLYPVYYPWNGGNPVIFYLIEWFNYNTGVWDALTSPSTTGMVLSYTHTVTVPFSSTETI